MEANATVACWLAPEFLIVFGDLEVPAGSYRGVLIAGDESLPSAVHSIPLAGRRRGLVVATEDSATVRTHEQLRLESGGGEFAPAELSVVELADMVDALSDLPGPARERLHEFVLASVPPYGVRQRDVALDKRLALMWKGLHQPKPSPTASAEAPFICVVEALMRVDENAFWIRGWMHDSEARISRLTVISPEGERIELLDRCLRHRRRDIADMYGGPLEDYGFISYFELERPSHVLTGWMVEAEDEAGTAIEGPTPELIRDLTTVRNSLLMSIPLDVLPNEPFMVDHVAPAARRLHQKITGAVRIANVTDYGEVPRDADVSIVIPLYQQINLIEHQLAQFVDDPDIRASELIYVLDSPEMNKYLEFQARELFRLYGVPFRIVEMERSVGFACSSNAGVSHATGRLLLMMNSDVIPEKPGWLNSMQRLYNSTESIGALGPKLLYEDDSIQHAGLYFLHPGDAPLLGIWSNWHYFKGMPRDLPAANVARTVPGVTGACMMIDKELYERVGGFPEIYLQGDHEDSELCLRLIQEGYENWYFPEVELYHLESRSYNMDLRVRLALYNRWLHSQRWGDFIAEIMPSYPLPEREGPPHYQEVGAARPFARSPQPQG